ncbi:MAG TPA: FadR/GntR family transcriptional regulator [Chloroflexota bacterium]|jgi:GntR family transcriptional repressor for pyruvate dehydrogenase complex|nr:FadR/GntR family transcriptional regulator [Chloroflexota bacterium]
MIDSVRLGERRGRWRKPPRLYEEVARDLADAIAGGRYSQGDFLPTEQALVREYGASRNVVREALKLLSARGMVDVLHGRGTRVAPRHQWQLLDQLVHLVREDRRVPRDLLELRRILEVEIAGLAAERGSPDLCAAMAETIDSMRAAPDRPEECIEHDIRFHRRLAEAAGNVLLPLVLEPVGQLLRASRLATIHNPGAIGRSIDAHALILARVEARDPAGAREAMRAHLIQAEAEIRRIQESEG